MIILEDIISFLKGRYPEELCEDWDNVGLMTGDKSQVVNKVLVCLDVTSDVVKEAIESGADLIISHHPLVFTKLKNVTEDSGRGSLLLKLIKNDISVYSMHTNFDKADGGMNDLLCEKFGLTDVRKFFPEELFDREGNPVPDIGRVGVLDIPMTLNDFADFVKATLGCRSMKIYGDGNENIETVCLCSGGGGDMLPAAYNSGADVYISGDLKHNHAMFACEMGINLIDAGHFETENIICDFVRDLFLSEFPELTVIKSEVAPYFRNV